MDVHNPHEACGYIYNGCIDARRPAYECPFFVHSETLNFELMWRRKYKKKTNEEWTSGGTEVNRIGEKRVLVHGARAAGNAMHAVST